MPMVGDVLYQILWRLLYSGLNGYGNLPYRQMKG